jgi:hypothetical protein
LLSPSLAWLSQEPWPLASHILFWELSAPSKDYLILQTPSFRKLALCGTLVPHNSKCALRKLGVRKIQTANPIIKELSSAKENFLKFDILILIFLIRFPLIQKS